MGINEQALWNDVYFNNYGNIFIGFQIYVL